MDDGVPGGRPALVVGEALVDVVRRADGTGGRVPGGSPANVALGLARLGRPTVLLTRLGDDPDGRLVAAHLAVSGVRVHPGPAAGVRTSTATADVGPDGAATYTFDLTWDLPGPHPSAGDPLNSVTDGAGDPVVAHTGSVAALLAPGAATVHRVVRDARATATTTYDPNLRPALLGPAATIRPQVEALVAVSDVVKLSDEDAAWLAPGTDPDTLARGWLDLGPAVVVLTRGGRGLTGWCAAGRVDVPAPRVDVVDTVGAGDAAMAGLLDALWSADLLGAHRRPALRAVPVDVLRAVLTGAARVAAVTVGRPGADPPTRAELV